MFSFLVIPDILAVDHPSCYGLLGPQDIEMSQTTEMQFRDEDYLVASASVAQ